VVDALEGVRLVVPNGFTVRRYKGALLAESTGYAIMIGPITTKERDLEAAARELAAATNMELDGYSVESIAGAERPSMTLHGELTKEMVAMTVVSYVGMKYRVAVTVTIPYAAVGDPNIIGFVKDVFEHRILVP